MAKDNTSIVLTGDIGFDRYMAGKWEDEQLFSPAVLDFFHSSDHTVANVEGALIDAKDDGSRGMCFHNMDPRAVCALEKIHADVWAIGNNHAMDVGREGLESTIRLARELGCRTIGAGLSEQEASAPVCLEDAGGVGLFCVAYTPDCTPATADAPGCFRWDDMEAIAKRIAQIKQHHRWCVIIAHGGEEFACLPNPYTRQRYLRYLELGADVVVGHHPHVPENYELLEDGKAIFYSLGNFIFDTDYQRAHPNTDTGVLLKLIFTRDRMDFDAMGIRIVRGEERIVEAPLPDIFTHIPQQEYQLLIPLSAKAFLADERRLMVYCDPEKYANASEQDWQDFFRQTPYGYVRGEHMDWDVIVPLARQAEDGGWRQSRLEKVKQYLLRLM